MATKQQRGGRALLEFCATHNVQEMRRELRRRRRTRWLRNAWWEIRFQVYRLWYRLFPSGRTSGVVTKERRKATR